MNELLNTKTKLTEQLIMVGDTVKEVSGSRGWEPLHVIVDEDKRYKLNSRVPKALRTTMLQENEITKLMDLINTWRTRCRPQARFSGRYWEGTAREWKEDADEDEELRPIVTKYSAIRLGRSFTRASKIEGSGVSPARSTKFHGVGNRYRILIDPERTEPKEIFGRTPTDRFRHVRAKMKSNRIKTKQINEIHQSP